MKIFVTLSFLLIITTPRYLLSQDFANDSIPQFKRLHALVEQNLERKPDSALLYINIGIKKSDKVESLTEKAWFTQQKGLLFMLMNDNKKSTEYLFESIQLYSLVHDTLGLARGYLNYGNITAKGDTARLYYYEKGLSLYRSTGNPEGIMKALNNIAMYYLDQNNLDSTRHYLQKAFVLAEKSNDINLKGTTLFNMAILEYKGNKSINQAITTLKELLEIPGIKKNQRLYVHSLHLISQLYITQKKFDSSYSYIQKTLPLTRDNYFFVRSQSLQMLSSYYQNRENYKEALIAQYKADSISLYLIKNDNKNLIDLLERENELKLNKERVEKLDAQVKQAFYAKLYLTLSLILAIIIGSYIAYLLKSRSEKDRAMLLAQEQKADTEQKLLQSELNYAQVEKEYLNEKLEFTKSELSDYTANFIQHNNIIHDLHQHIDEARKAINNPDQQQKLKELSIQLNQTINRDDARKILLENAMKVNDELFFELKKQHPNLNEKDLHLISFIKLGLSSKEIADIYNIETQSVHTKRYRLRKKIGIDSDQSFEDFINKTVG